MRASRAASGQLQAHLRAIITEHGRLAQDGLLELIIDFTRALLLAGVRLSTLGDGGLEPLARRLGARTGLPVDLVVKLVRQAMAPEHRATHRHEELAAFGARFGADAAAQLAEQDQDAIDLPGFARRHGSADAMLLLDALVELHARGGGIDTPTLTRLQHTADSLGVDGVLFGTLLRKHDPRHAQGEQRFDLEGGEISIGRRPGCGVQLLDPQVAPLHARLVRSGEGWRVVDAGSGRATVVDGEAVASAPLELGQRLRIGPFSLSLAAEGDTLVAESDRAFSALTLRNVQRTIVTKELDKALLSDVGFTAYSGEVIAVVGPSGSGKTTLLNAITGIFPPDSGEVMLDGASFHRLLEYDRSVVGIVPQDDLVHPELSVEEALRYAGKLRFPTDVTSAEVDAAVDRVVQSLDIQDIRSSRIGDVQKRGISGGQRKRVNLGQELLTRSTRILFLDEPTSGLDPRAAQDIGRLARRLADEGRIVFLVTHDLTPAVIRQVDHLLVLHRGGHVIFFGPPDEANAFFKVPTPDGLFLRLEDHSPADWAAAYRSSPAWQKYVATREYLVQSGDMAAQREKAQAGAAARAPRRSFLKDLWTQTSRYAHTKWRDRLGAAVLTIQPPLLALVMLIVFPEPTAPCIFMLALSSLWFGMSSSVRELISDRAIWRRERRVGARLLPYAGAKILVLGAVVTLQCAVLTTLLFYPLGLQHHGFSLPLLAAVQALTGLAGMSLGLVVSASFTSSEAAVGTLPLLIVPQITFSAIMVPIQRMGVVAKAATWVTIQRYALDASVKAGEALQVAYKYDKTRWEKQVISGTLYDLGLKPLDPDDMGLSITTLMAALAAFSAVFLAAALVITRLRDRQGA